MPSPILILDGGLGTSLEDKYSVHFSSATTPLWSSHLLLTDLPTLLRCQSDFAACPVDILETATYQISPESFARTPLPVSATATIPSAVLSAVNTAHSALAHTACPAAHTALSFGPYGACMVPSTEYSGAYDTTHLSSASLLAWHAARFALFTRDPRVVAGVAYMAFETVPRLSEILALRALLASVDVGSAKVWISCVFPGAATGLPDGTSARDALRGMLAPEHGGVPWGVGVNCTKIEKLEMVIAAYEEALAEMVREGSVREKPALVVYPDGTNGEVYNTTTQVWEIPEGVERPKELWEMRLAQIVKGVAERGMWKEVVVGGCCKASHLDIAKLRALVK
ncbi:hypothetical protein TD95_005344 [Thielaviopsis punctulata]|uniref:Hcy-binding domain-containing protein n=1 Tax=Thielaviopsis punctulata TaxID=72032 RepID=A0A0F4ZHQ4_9PEZI|nr:hypothetical protein TD95_005344 [Thielaviopsis punctulata]